MLFQGVGHSDGVHHRSQHTHGVGMGTLHFVRAVLDTPPEITGTQHQTNLHAHFGTAFDGLAHIADHIKVQATVGIAR